MHLNSPRHVPHCCKGHEQAMKQSGKPIVAREFPKIPADPAVFDGAMGLDWHAGVEAATANVHRRVRGTV